MERTELPAGWRWTTVGDIASAINSGFPSGSHNQDGDGIPHLRPMNVSSDGTIELSVTKYVPDDGKPHDRLQANDVLFNNTNSPVLLGKTAAIKHDTDWAYSNHMTRIRLKADQATGSWVAMCLHFLFRTGFFMQNCRNHVNQASINSSFLADEVWIPLPSLSEQKRIIEIVETQFTRLDAAVAALKRVQANLRRYRAAVLKAACEGRLVPTEAELAQAEGRTYEPAAVLLERILAERRAQWQAEHPGKKYKEPTGPDVSALPELPGGWCWATVEQVASNMPRSIQSGPFGSSLLHSEFQDSGILAIGIDNVLEGRFSLGRQHRISERKFQELKKYAVRPLDVLITVMATVGRCCVVPADVEEAIVTKHLYRISVDRLVLDPHYLMYALSGGEFVREQIFGRVQGQTRPGINGEILKSTAIPLPPLVEQQRIVDGVAQRLSVKEQYESAVATSLIRSGRLRQAILQRAFSGDLTMHQGGGFPIQMTFDM